MSETASGLEWPVMSMADADAFITAPGTPLETEEMVIRGTKMRVWKEAPSSLRALLEISRGHGDHVAVVYEGERITYTDQHKAIAKLAHELVTTYGIKKGDRIGLVMRNYPEWPIVFWAATCVGAILVPLNAWWTGAELEYGLNDSGCRLAFIDTARAISLAEHADNLTTIEHMVVVRGNEDLSPHLVRWENLVAAPGTYSELPDIDVPECDIETDDDATIFYTSGTTGKPKGALGTHRNILSNVLGLMSIGARAMMRRGEMPTPPDPDAPKTGMLLSVPLFHATGCHAILMGTTLQGNKLVIMHKWDALRAMELIQDEKLASFGGVPAMVWQVLEHPRFKEFDLSSVESIGYGGAPSAPELVARIKEEFPDVSSANGYGLTETSAAISQNSAEDYVNRPNSAGVPTAVTDVRVVGSDGQDLPAGEIGELWVRGPNVVKGYWNKPEATEEAFGGGWFRTGDLVKVDEEGFLYILDRAKDMLIRGGENVYCVEVEDALYSHEDVMDAAVVGIPHKILGEEVGAVVQVVEGSTLTEEALQAHVGVTLAGFKVPINIEFRHEPLPRNANGKIVKRDLRVEYLANIGRSEA
jgi:long-chain acyl-CoA synthetase